MENADRMNPRELSVENHAAFSNCLGGYATDIDFTGDGMVDFFDIAIIQNYYGLVPGPSGNDVCP